MDQHFANDHQDGTTSCKWSSRSTSLLQMIFWINRPLTNDHQDRPAHCKWSSFSFSVILLQILSSFSSTVNLLHCNNIILVSKYIPHFFLAFALLCSKYDLPFPSTFYFSPAKKNNLPNIMPLFPSLFIFSSKDPKLNILESSGSILIIYLV